MRIIGSRDSVVSNRLNFVDKFRLSQYLHWYVPIFIRWQIYDIQILHDMECIFSDKCHCQKRLLSLKQIKSQS